MSLENIDFEVIFSGGQGAVTIQGDDFGSKTFPDSRTFSVRQAEGHQQVIVSGIAPPSGAVNVRVSQDQIVLANELFTGQFHHIITYEVNNTGPK